MLLSLVLLFSGCTSDKQRRTTNALCQILIRDASPIEQFMHPEAGEVLHATLCQVGQNEYLVFFNHRRDTAVAYDLGTFKAAQLDVWNHGFGRLLTNGDWSLFHTNGPSGFFESQGGLATLHEIAEAMQQCAKGKPSVQFNWPSAKAGTQL
jgi:hypothetical protein